VGWVKVPLLAVNSGLVCCRDVGLASLDANVHDFAAALARRS